MTTRRTVLRLAGAAPAVALMSACRSGSSPAPAANADLPRELLAVETGSGLTLVNTHGGPPAMGARQCVVASDATALASGRASAAGTLVEVRRPNGQMSFDLTVRGQLAPRVVASGGQFVALATGPAGGDVAYRPVGREKTTIVIADHSGERQRLELVGCVEPEAFAPGGEWLYVLDYLPPEDPERYRVRRVDLASGAYGALSTRDKQLIPAGYEEEMRGEGRQAVYAGQRQFLFTLYTHQPDHEHTRDLLAARAGKPDVHAFVHSLNTALGFAYCIDLPAPFGNGPAQAHAIALTPSTQHPYVVDTSSGTVARLDGEQLTVIGVGNFAPNPAGDPAAAAIRNGNLYVGAGETIHLIDIGKLTTRATWRVPAAVRGVAISLDGDRLWVGQPDAVIALDAATGLVRAQVSVPGLTALRHVASAA